MIRYVITPKTLLKRIDAHAPKWRNRASTLTTMLRTSKAKKKVFKPLWSEIKDVYINLQHSKCVFCEKELEGLPFGRVEQDVEHFRPKGAVKPWTVPESLTNAGVVVRQPTSRKAEAGYPALAYHPLNYAMACKTCNSALKRDQFPIAGTRRSKATDPTRVGSERALLIYPIGNVDADPETLIGFNGVSPTARAASGHRRNRALVTIEFFKLDMGAGRELLVKARGRLIEAAYFALRMQSEPGSAADRALAKATLNRMVQQSQPHASCVRSFVQLFKKNRKEAESMAEAIQTLFNTMR